MAHRERRNKMTRILLIILITLAVAPLLVPATALAQNSDWSVSAANWMQYWYHRPEPYDSIAYSDRQSRQDSLDNRFTVDFNFGQFYAGAWLRTLQPNLNENSYEELTQRYLGWHEDGLTLHAGNFYQTFDRGITLNAFLDDAVYFDNNLDGIKVSGMYDKIDFDALSARGYKFEGNGRISEDRIYTLRAVRGALKPVTGIRTGFSYVRFKQDSFDFTDPTNSSNISAVNATVNRGPIDLYGEYAIRRGRNVDDTKVEGDISYASASYSHSLFSLYGEYKNMINFLYPGPVGPYNTPPPVSHSGRTLVSLTTVSPGERAYQIGALISPTYDINLEVSCSESYSRGSNFEGNEYAYHLGERYVGLRVSPIQKLVFNSHWDRFDYTIEEEVESYFDGYFYLDPIQTLSFAAYTRRFWPGDQDYHEDYLTVGYSRGNFIQINIGGSKSNNPVKQDPEKLAFIETTLRFKSHELVIFQGGERGGLVCSSGICSIRPTFQGTRIMLFSRF